MAILIIVSIGFISAIVSPLIIFATQSAKRKQEAEQKQNEIKRLRAKIIHDIFADFQSLGWTSWDISIHWADGQMDRMERASHSRTMKIVPDNMKLGEVDVIGESGQLYHVSGDGCTCKDFCTRHLPCKHMYFVAMEQTTRSL